MCKMVLHNRSDRINLFKFSNLRSVFRVEGDFMSESLTVFAKEPATPRKFSK